MGITEESSKVGGMGGVTTEQSMRFSRDCTNSHGAACWNPPSIQSMLRANSIPKMHLHEGYTPQNPFSFHQYNSQQHSINSSSTYNHYSHQTYCEPSEISNMPRQSKSSTTMLTRGLTFTLGNAVNISGENLTVQTHDPSMKFDQPLPISRCTNGVKLRPCCTGLAPWTLNLQLHCLAWDRLSLWHLSSSRSNAIGDVEVLESEY